jgi:hypothetical protein
VPKRRTSRYTTSEPSSNLTTARRWRSSTARPFRGSVEQVPVIRRWIRENRPDSNRTTKYLPRRSTAATRSPLQLGGHAGGVERAREARVEDLHALAAGGRRARLQPHSNRLDLRKLGHRASLAGSNWRRGGGRSSEHVEHDRALYRRLVGEDVMQPGASRRPRRHRLGRGVDLRQRLPSATRSPGLSRHTTPTAWSMMSSFVCRPAPRCSAPAPPPPPSSAT